MIQKRIRSIEYKIFVWLHNNINVEFVFRILFKTKVVQWLFYHICVREVEEIQTLVCNREVEVVYRVIFFNWITQEWEERAGFMFHDAVNVFK